MWEISLDTDILITTLMAVGKTVGVALVGAWLCRSGRWSRASVEEMSTITSKVFLPCFVIASLAKLVSFQKLGSTAVVMAICLIQAVVGSVLGLASCMALGIPDDLRGSVLMSIVFGNSSAMPLILFEETASLFPGTDAAKVGTLYVLMYSMVNRFLMWTVGIVALGPVSGSDANGASQSELSLSVLSKALFNENNIGSAIGLVIALTPLLHSTFLGHGPGVWITEIFELVGQVANPMMMFVLGANLGGGFEDKHQGGYQEPCDAHDEFSSDCCNEDMEENGEYKVCPVNSAAADVLDSGRTSRNTLHRLDIWMPEGRKAHGIYGQKLSHKVAAMQAVVRMVIMPVCVYGLLILVDASPIPWQGMADPVLTFVVLLQACVPGAIQLILIADYAKAGPRVSKALGEMLLWQHVICPITMSLYIAFFLVFAGVEKDTKMHTDTFPDNGTEVETAYALLRHSLGFHTDGL